MKKLSLVKPEVRKTVAEKKANPPTHLAKETQKWWAAVVEDFVLDQHHERLLTAACESWDRCEQARKRLAKNGLTFHDRFNQPRSRADDRCDQAVVRDVCLYANIIVGYRCHVRCDSN